MCFKWSFECYESSVFILLVEWDHVSLELLQLTDPLSVLGMVYEWIWSTGGKRIDRERAKFWFKNVTLTAPKHNNHINCLGTLTLTAPKHNNHINCLGTELCHPRLESGYWSPELCCPRFNIWTAMLGVAVPNTRLESGDWSPELCCPLFNIWTTMLRVAVPNMLCGEFSNTARKT